LIEMVSKGEIDYTIADENVAKMLRNFYPNLYIETPLSLTQRIAWAIRKGNDSLNHMVTEWVNTNRGKAKYNVIYNKYFKYRRLAMQTENYFHTVQQGDISDIDRLIKEYSEEINWDWRLVAALINKESKFNPYAESPYGAKGLMQLLPTTAARFGVNPDEIFTPQKNIMAGTRFLNWLDIRLEGILDDTTDIQKFVLASYNVGLGHVLDARRLAKKYGKDPDNWEDVSEFLLKKSNPKYYSDPVVKYGYCRGKEPVNYVRKILEYYNLYSMYAAA
ncbi:MAG: transglycosylase SLT domain-containing protein, partial [Bacteroidota bacterium]|nr:transglycosylase SLT domain-containing protein [Bacteroidota bacterium]